MTLVINRDAALAPDLDIVAVVKRFDASGADEFTGLDPDRHVLGSGPIDVNVAI